MELRRVAETLLRSHRSISIVTASPQSASRPFLSTSTYGANGSLGHSHRRFSSQPWLREDSKAKRDGSAPTTSSPDLLRRRTTFLDEVMGDRSSTTSKPISERPRTSVDDLVEAARFPSRIPPSKPVGSRGSTYAADGVSTWGGPQRAPVLPPNESSKFGTSGLKFPSLFNSSSALSKPTPRPRVIQELDIHVRARTGRSIKVDPGKANDLGAKLRKLTTLVGRNGIARDFRAQRFHERPGLKRKRLASQRWRREFKTRFLNAITRVQELKLKGW